MRFLHPELVFYHYVRPMGWILEGRWRMHKDTMGHHHHHGFFLWFSRLPVGKKVILVVFLIWLAQALPKWSVAIMADGEMSANIVKFFITPQ